MVLSHTKPSPGLYVFPLQYLSTSPKRDKSQYIIKFSFFVYSVIGRLRASDVGVCLLFSCFFSFGDVFVHNWYLSSFEKTFEVFEHL